ncbi:MAG: hypothetical protein C0514_01005 [Candidatus Puniceispirillum sp.]|nr:hypothetical protein [Candidatus Puniceispirillum sp.]
MTWSPFWRATGEAPVLRRIFLATLCLTTTPSFASPWLHGPRLRPLHERCAMEGDTPQDYVQKIAHLSEDLIFFKNMWWHDDTKEAILISRGHLFVHLANHAAHTGPFTWQGAPRSALDLCVLAGQDLIGRDPLPDLAIFYVTLLEAWPGDQSDVGLKDFQGKPLTQTMCQQNALTAAFQKGHTPLFVRVCKHLLAARDWSMPFDVDGRVSLTREDMTALITHFEPRQGPQHLSCLRDPEGASKLMPLKYFGF